MLPETGQKFGPYEILARLGGGGMGVVFRAWDDRLHREVAIKMLHDEYQAPRMRQRFLLEARAASSLAHPNICTIFDIGEQEGEPYLVMELLEGVTLKDKIARHALSAEEMVHFGEEIAEALAAAHARGIVHRDIKPANIFLQAKPGGDSQIKVLDFGLAKVSMALRSGRDSRALELTAAGSTVGTLAYMSPEQARGESLDLRSDLFSLGIVLYEMATRRTPFRGATAALAFHALLASPPEPIRTWNATVPRELERIITRLLAKDRSERHQTAGEVQEVLHKLATRSDGDWLRKLPRAAVPLVPAVDPIARTLRLHHGETSASDVTRVSGNSDAAAYASSTSAAAEEANLGFSGSAASADPNLLRPRRLTLRESGPRESRFGSASASTKPRSEPDQLPPGEGDRVQEVLTDTLFPTELGPEQGVSDKVELSSPFSVQPVAEPKPRPERVAESASPSASAPLETSSSEMAAAQSVPEKVNPAGRRAAHTQTDPSPSRPRQRLASTQDVVVPVHSPVHSPVTPKAAPNHRRAWLIGISSAAVLAVLLFLFGLRSGSLGQIVLSPSDAVLLTPVLNRTGDPLLDDVVTEGLELQLEQRSKIAWRGLAALRAGIRRVAAEDHLAPEAVSARAVAQRINARLYLYGELSGSPEHYNLRVDVIEARSNDRLGSLSDTANGKDELAAAITRLAEALRRKLGEGDVISREVPATPLAQQATASMPALEAFAKAETASANGNPIQAAHLYQQAATLSPGFALAELRLAWIDETQGAEIEAAESASRARASANRSGDRVTLLSRIAAEAIAEADLSRAAITARELAAARPHDAEALLSLARVMRLSGHLTEALLSAQQVMRLQPYSADAYEEVSLALVGLDRYDAAQLIATKAAAQGIRCDCARTAATYLKRGTIDAEAGFSEEDFRPSLERALAFDDTGNFASGLLLWQEIASRAQGDAQLRSTAAHVLSRAALNRALWSRCSDVPELVARSVRLPFGQPSAAHLALAEAICGDSANLSGLLSQLTQNARPRSETTQLEFPLIHCAQALATKQAVPALAAISALQATRDLPPVVHYFFGLAYEAGRQDELAASSFQAVADHPGASFLTGSVASELARSRVSARAKKTGHQV